MDVRACVRSSASDSGQAKMASLEAEICWLAWWRLGFEAGSGVGKVFAEVADFPDAAWLPGIWGSTTLKVMEKQDIRARRECSLGRRCLGRRGAAVFAGLP